jgi:hypothetical protein
MVMKLSNLLISITISVCLAGCLVNNELYEERLESLSDDDADGFSGAQGDCNDNDPDVFPGASEICNEVDDDCDGYIDNNITDGGPWYSDADGDGYGDPDTAVMLCAAPGESWLQIGGDCNDEDTAVSPDADELCNQADDDCDGFIDNDPVDGAVWYPDDDDDGYGNDASPQTTCEDTTDLLTAGGDCDDTDDAVNPDAEEICNDRVDNDCNDSADHCIWAAEIDMRWEILIEASYADDGLSYAGAVGDLNGDGAAELLLSSYYAYVEETGTRPGTIQAFDLPITESITRRDAARSFTGEGDADAFGVQLAVLDLDGDGYDDLVAGARSHDPDGVERAGSTFVFYGPLSGDALATDADWTLQGETEYGRLGEALGGIGDFDGDSVPDFVSGSHYFPAFDDIDSPGLVHVYTHAGTGAESASEVAYLTVYGAERSISLGSSLVGVDIDGDGFSELLLGADESEDIYGGVYLFEEGRSGTLSTEDADQTWRGESYVSYAGEALDALGDVNNDGFDDVLITAPQAGDGSAYIVWGGAERSLATLADADITIRGTQGGGRNFGGTGHGVGDLNEDGAVDILVAEGGVAPNDAYVFYGPFDVNMVLADTDADIVLTGDQDEDEDYNLAIGGLDFTGDAVPDLLVGSHQNDLSGSEGGEWAGTAYIIPGVGL